MQRLPVLFLIFAIAPLGAQVTTLSLDPTAWTATDSIRAEPWLGRQSLRFGRGVALANGTDLRNGTLEMDVAFDSSSNNVGFAFHARDRNAFEVIFFRPALSDNPYAVQYAPALHNLGTAWQLYFGDGYTAATTLVRNRWMHVALRIHGDSADLFLDHATEPVLRVPHLVLGADAGTEVGIWTGAFGNGAHWANISYTRDDTPHRATTAPIRAGTIMEWELSPVYDAERVHPGVLPDFKGVAWQKVRAEAPGFVLINRYVAAPAVLPPVNHPDSIYRERVPGSKVIYLRTTVTVAKAELRRMAIAYSDGATIFCNGVPLYAGMRPSGLNGGLGEMYLDGEGVYLPLRAGQNEIVVAVTEYFGGWAFAGRWGI